MSADWERRLQYLEDREAIRDCLARYSRGVDRLDRELIISAYHPDAIDDHGKFIGSPAELADWVLGMHTSAHIAHQHALLQQSCEVDGATAHTETYFMFIGVNREGPPISISGGRYIDRLERREIGWRILRRLCIRDWALIDHRLNPADLSSLTATSHLLSAEVRRFMNAGPAPRRDHSDPSYQRPLDVSPDRLDRWGVLQRAEESR
jgi:hypothetical protein